MTLGELLAMTSFAVCRQQQDNRLLAQEYACNKLDWDNYITYVPVKLQVTYRCYQEFVTQESMPSEYTEETNEVTEKTV